MFSANFGVILEIEREEMERKSLGNTYLFHALNIAENKEKYDTEVYYRYLLFNDTSLEAFRSQKKIIEEKNGAFVVQNNLDDLISLHINAGSWVTTNNHLTHFIDGNSKIDA